MEARNLMSLLSRIKRAFSGEPTTAPTAHDHPHGHDHDHARARASARAWHPDEPASRHERREAGRERHHETGEPAWRADDRIEDPRFGREEPRCRAEILGGS